MSKSARFPHVEFDLWKPQNDRRTDMSYFEPSKTRQEFAEECDINAIMARYEATGVITHGREDAPVYMDLTDVPDFQRSMDQLIIAQEAFMTLPARVRREFDNDPRAFVDYASDPQNLDQMRQWGLAPPAPQEPPEVVPEPSQAPVAPSPKAE